MIEYIDHLVKTYLVFHVVSGAVKDSVGTFDVIHYICCVCMILGGCLVLCYPIIKRMEEKRNPTQPEQPVEITVDE